MEIIKPAMAGTLESSDCQVTVEAGEGRIDLELDSVVINQFGNQIRRVALEKDDDVFKRAETGTDQGPVYL